MHTHPPDTTIFKSHIQYSFRTRRNEENQRLSLCADPANVALNSKETLNLP